MALLTACSAHVVASRDVGLPDSPGPGRTLPTRPPRTVSAARGLERSAKCKGSALCRGHTGPQATQRRKSLPQPPTTNLHRARSTLGPNPASSGVWSRNLEAANTANHPACLRLACGQAAGLAGDGLARARRSPSRGQPASPPRPSPGHGARLVLTLPSAPCRPPAHGCPDGY